LEFGEITHLATAPFIFCRNVFIYFSSATIAQVVRRFSERMPLPSYLFVGVSESLLRIGTTFELEEIAGTFVYVRR
jgi:chemotaxis protein methyltransferase CheR